MTLRLSIENMDRLPDGGPVRVEVKGRGLDIGRDAHLDWTLPDPSRTVSSKHCEIRFRDGGYWLHDVSTNGTFVNGAPIPARRALSPARRRPAGHRPLHRRGGGRGPVRRAARRCGRRRRRALRPATSGARSERPPPPTTAAPIRPTLVTSRRRTFSTSPRFIAPAEAPGVSPPATGADDWLDLRPAAGAGGAAVDRAAAAAAAPPRPGRDQPPRPVTAPPRHPTVAAAGRAAAPSRRARPRASTFCAHRPRRGHSGAAIAGRDPDALADEIGSALRLMAQNLAQIAVVARRDQDADAHVEPHDDPGAARTIR